MNRQSGSPVSLRQAANAGIAASASFSSHRNEQRATTYAVSGPDINVISKQPAGLGIIHLTLQIPATAARTLFIQTTNLDKTAASGALEVR